MPTDTERAYVDLPADTRLEVRLPSLLKEHAALVAATRSERLSDLVVEALAEKVSQELAAVRSWKLTVPEQTQLLRVLVTQEEDSPAMVRARKRAAQLFGKAAVPKR
jgi:uncharacterized protein (DUF1778 family)